jgi:arginine repressor
MIQKKKKTKFPPRKISETFLEFSLPLLESLGKDVNKYKVEQVLKIAFTAWNAVVIDTVKGNSQYVARIRELTRDDPMSNALIEQMISRKQDMFSDDLRMIGRYRVTQKRGEWRLRAEARDPSTID